ncbi:MAG: hypothetical protein SGPRY_000450, partial [Prymnesium sp.]
GDLQQLLERHGCLSEGSSVSITFQLASALDHVHCHDILHRDIKLENVLVSSADSPKIKLCDFGHSARISALTRSDRFLGTPGYAPPEVRG